MGKLSWVAAVLPLCPFFAAPAYGDGDAITGYVGQHGGEVCAYVSDQPDLAGVRQAVDYILATSGLPEDQTGRLLGGSVATFCPEDAELVEEFVWYVRHRQSSPGIGIGAILGK